MVENILVSFRLTIELWRQFYAAHFSCDPSVKFHYLMGAVCILIGALGFGGFYPSWWLAGLLMATGFYGVMLKYLLIYRSLRAARRHPFFGKELWVSVGLDEISVRSEDSGYSQPWSNFTGYRKLAPGFLLYHDKNSFFFIPVSELSAGQIKRVEQNLARAQVPNLAESGKSE